MNNVHLNDLRISLKTNQGIFIQGIGFDIRCLAVLSNLDTSQFEAIIGIQNLHSKHKNSDHESKLLELTNNKALIIGSNCRSVIDLIDELSDELTKIQSLPFKEIFFDITSLSHELLVVIVGLLNELDLLKNTTFLYTQAKQYGDWLSRGINQIRSILGFSGLMYPSRKLHLIVLLGFEIERAERLIDSYEPAKLTLGTGHKEQSISSDIYQINNETRKKIENLIFLSGLNIENIDNFHFSCLDPFLMKNQILEYIENLDNRQDYNIVIAPMNNKVSTLGVAFAALDNEDLQICYAEAEEYNYKNYVEINNLVSVLKFEI